MSEICNQLTEISNSGKISDLQAEISTLKAENEQLREKLNNINALLGEEIPSPVFTTTGMEANHD